MALERITITIPKDVLAAADRQARQLGRSRSWVITEAVRGYARTSGVSEPPPPYAAEAVAEARTRHLLTALQLTPAERLRRADELTRLARAVRPARRGRRQQIIAFDAYEDFYEWKKARRAGT